MRHTLNCLLLTLSLLFVGIGNVWGEEYIIYETGFESSESFTAATNYQSTVKGGPNDKQWEIYFGNFSKTDNISGEQSVALRLYTSKNYGYLKSCFKLPNFTKMTFKAKASTANNANIHVTIQYSIDGTNWSPLFKDSPDNNIWNNASITTQAKEYSAFMPSANSGKKDVYLKISIDPNSTHPSEKNAQLTIDDITIYSLKEDKVPLTSPENLQSTNITTNSATLSWNSVEHATGYVLKVGNTEYQNTTSPHQLSGLSIGTEYTWGVKAVGGEGYEDSEYATATFTTKATPANNYSIQWYVNGQLYTEGAPSTNVEGGNKVTTLPSIPPSPDETYTTFVGWTTTEIAEETSEKPNILFLTAADAPIVTGDTKYYAVFRKENGDREDKTIIIDKDTKNFPTTYASSEDYQLDGYNFNITQIYINGEKLQWRAAGNTNGTGTIYNKDPLHNIQKIILSYNPSDSYKNISLKLGRRSNPEESEEIEPSIYENEYTFDCSSKEYDYFVLTNGEYAGYITSIVIKFLEIPYTYSTSVNTLQNIEISEDNNTEVRLSYLEGESFDPTGLVVTGTYLDGSTKQITEGILWSFTPDQLDGNTTTVSVNASIGNIKSSTYVIENISVSAITSIEIIGTPSKTEYEVGDKFSFEGLKVIVTYSNGKTDDITSSTTWNDIPEFAFGTTTITITASYHDKTSSKNYSVQIKKKEASINISDMSIALNEQQYIPAVTIPEDASIKYTIEEGDEFIVIEGNNIIAKKVGLAKVRAAFAENEVYTCAETMFRVKVFGKCTWDLTKEEYESSSPDEVKWESGQATMTLNKGESQTNANNYLGKEGGNNHTRIYDKQILSIMPILGYNITKIEIVTSAKGMPERLVNWSNVTESSIEEKEVILLPEKETKPVSITFMAKEDAKHCNICSVTVYYTQNTHPLCTITWSANNDTAKETYYSGDEIKFPTPDNIPEDYYFQGWIDHSIDGVTQTKPQDFYKELIAAQDQTFFAVYAHKNYSDIAILPNPIIYNIVSSEVEFVNDSKEEIWSYNAFTNKYNGIIYYHLNNEHDQYIESPNYTKSITNITFRAYNPAGSDRNASISSNTSSSELLKETVPPNEFFEKEHNIDISGECKKFYIRSCYKVLGFRDIVVTFGEPYCDFCTSTQDPTITISSAGYGTYYNSHYSYVMPEGMEGYAIDYTNHWELKKCYEKGQVVPAGEPLVIKAAKGTYKLAKGESENDTQKRLGTNYLEGTDTPTMLPEDNSYYFYALTRNKNKEDNSVGFYWMNTSGSAFANGAHKAYLKIEKSKVDGVKMSGFSFNDEIITAIEVLEDESMISPVYNLAGQRIANTRERGIYIMNGKKYIVK